MAPRITRQEIFEVWSSNSKQERCIAVYDFVLGKFDQVVLSDSVIKELKRSLRSLCQQIELRWEKCHRIRDRFLKNNFKWLQEILMFPER